MLNYVITGTSRGIGSELTRQVLEAGHTVFALAREPLKAKALTQLKEKYPDRLKIFTVDVTSDQQVSDFAAELSPKTAIDILINNAGIGGESASFKDLSLSRVEEVFAMNSVSPMRVTRALLPFLQRSKSPKVIHISSLMGSIHDNASGGSYGYRMSKAALNMFHKSFSIEYPKVISLVVHPGWVKTDMGGANAPLTPKDSAQGVLTVTEDASLHDSGKFFNYDGDELAW